MAFTKEQAERYSRHFVLKDIGVSGQKKLAASKALLIGAGALGSTALMYLAAAGVGTVGIADGDKVELSNLNRQIIHRTDRVGMMKVESAKRTVLEINPDISVEVYPERMTPDNIRTVIREYDFIIDGTDSFESKFLINDACVLESRPYSHAGAVAFEGQTMTYVPGQGPCLRCLLGDVPKKAVSCAEAGVLGAIPGMLGTVQAAEAVKYLLGKGDLLTGRVLCVDGLNMRIQTIGRVKADADCPVCGKYPTILSLDEKRTEYDRSCRSCSPAEEG